MFFRVFVFLFQKLSSLHSIHIICVALTLNAMLRLDRNPPSQLWGQHSAKACTAPTQLRTLALLLPLAPERAQCSSGPGGLRPASARGSRRTLASTRVLSRARMYQS